jgi:hypothetical protein
LLVMSGESCRNGHRMDSRLRKQGHPTIRSPKLSHKKGRRA